MSKPAKEQRIGKFFLSEPTAKYKSYRICWYDERKRQTVGISTGTADRGEAEKALAEHNLRQSKEQLKDEPLMNACNRYFLEYAHALPSAETVKRAMKRTMDVLGNPLCSEMDNTLQMKLITTWREGGAGEHFQKIEGEDPIGPVSDATIDRRLGTLWAAMNFAEENKHLANGSIPKRVSRKRWKPNFGRTKTVLRLEDLAKLFDAACRLDEEVPTLRLIPPRGKYTSFRIDGAIGERGHRTSRSLDTADLVEAQAKKLAFERALKSEQTSGPKIVYGAAWRFLIIMIGTAARSRAVLDLSKTNGQVDFKHHVLDLNPPGRRQTTKHRAMLKMAPTLESWLKTWEPVNAAGQYLQVARGRNLFNNLIRKSGIHATPKMLRTFVGTWMASHAVPTWDRDMFMGHRKPSEGGNPTGDYYTIYQPQYLKAAAEAIEALYQELAPLLTIGDLLQRGYSEDQPAPLDDRQTGWLAAWMEVEALRLVGMTDPTPIPQRAPVLEIIRSPNEEETEAGSRAGHPLCSPDLLPRQADGVRPAAEHRTGLHEAREPRLLHPVPGEDRGAAATVPGEPGALGTRAGADRDRDPGPQSEAAIRSPRRAAQDAQINLMVGAEGVEPSTSCMSRKRSTAELRAPEIDPNPASFGGETTTDLPPAWRQRGAAEGEGVENQAVSSDYNHDVKVQS